MPMKQIILETAQAWLLSRPHEGHEIMTQIIDTVTVENMKEKMITLLETTLHHIGTPLFMTPKNSTYNKIIENNQGSTNNGLMWTGKKN